MKAALFDLDGTLLDSAPDLIGALNHVRASEGLSPVSVDDYRQYVSQGAVGMLNAGMPATDEQKFEGWKQEFLAYYQNHSTVLTAPFPGVDEMLAILEQRGVPWAVVTNKAEYLTIPVLEQIGWLERATAVVCGDTLEVNKPHPEPVELAAKECGVLPQHTIMVGDDPRDLDAARAAGALPVLVAWGYGSKNILDAGLGDAKLAETTQDLLMLLDSVAD